MRVAYEMVNIPQGIEQVIDIPQGVEQVIDIPYNDMEPIEEEPQQQPEYYRKIRKYCSTLLYLVRLLTVEVSRHNLPGSYAVLMDVKYTVEYLKCTAEAGIDIYSGELSVEQYNSILLSIYHQETRVIYHIGQMRENMDAIIARHQDIHYPTYPADVTMVDIVEYYQQLCSAISNISFVSQVASFVEKHQLFGYVTKDKNDCLNMDCPICLDSKDTDNMCQTNCNHYFCLGCIKTHEGNEKFQRSKLVTCPMCREHVTEVKVFK
jgi:hypothetical protein